MTRSDGVFPQYAKFALDPNDPPIGWDDGVRRCIRCRKSWPGVPQFGVSPCCGVTAGIVMNQEPEMTWREACSALNHARFEYYYEVWNENLTDEELFWTTLDYENLDELADELAKLSEWLEREYGIIRDGTTIKSQWTEV